MLPNIVVEIVILSPQDFLMKSNKKNSIYLKKESFVTEMFQL